MKKIIVQIYEVTSPEEARQLAGLRVDNIGVLVGSGEYPREVSIERAREIFAAVPHGHGKVALSLSSKLEDICDIAARIGADILHLGTAPESLFPADILELKRRFPGLKIMRSIPVADERSLQEAKQYDGVADYLLLDSYNPEDTQIGATGLTRDWSISKKIVESVKIPVILAGGLGTENVVEAIRQANPNGVDSKTRTDNFDGTAKERI